MKKRNAKQDEHVRTGAMLLELVEVAEKNRETMKDYDADAQAYFLLDTFDAADCVYAIWANPLCQFGYDYSIMKGDYDSEAISRIPGDAMLNLTALFHENADTARLMRKLHYVIRERPVYDESYRLARAAWLATTPANLAKMKARDEGNSPA